MPAVRSGNVKSIARLCRATQLAPHRRATLIARGYVAATRPRPALKRGPSSKTSAVQLDNNAAPQGLVSPSAPDDVVAGGYPHVMQQALENMHKFENCVVLTKVGNFYELYFHQAKEIGEDLLHMKLAFKHVKDHPPVPIAGFPFYQLERYLKQLVEDHGKSVAIVEETLLSPLEQELKGRKNDREVKRIVSPGMLIDETFLNPYEHNYLLAVHVEEALLIPGKEETLQVGLSWLDLSSGDFFTQATDITNLPSAITRIGAREIVVEQALQAHQDPRVQAVLEQEASRTVYYEPGEDAMDVGDWTPMLEDAVSSVASEAFTTHETVATSLLLQYTKSRLPGLQLKLQAPIRRHADDHMSIDRNTLRGLEVVRTLRDGTYKGSLLHAVRKTSTESGSRLLAQRLASPSMSLPVINERLDLVEELLGNEILLKEVVALLNRTHDCPRLVQKFALGRGEAYDLLKLSETITITRSIAETLTKHVAASRVLPKLLLRFNLAGPGQLSNLIEAAIDQEGLMTAQRKAMAEKVEAAGLARDVLAVESDAPDLASLQKRVSSKRLTKASASETDADETVEDKEVWIMKRNASQISAQLHNLLDEMWLEKKALRDSLREKLGSNTLTLRLTPGLGHICHIKGSRDMNVDLSRQLPDARTVGSSKSTKSFYYHEWTRLGNRIEETKGRIRKEELALFKSLREQVIQNLVPLRRNAAAIDELDVGCSFALLAREHGLTRPILNHTCDYRVHGGWHMIVSSGLSAGGRSFTPNDCILYGDQGLSTPAATKPPATPEHSKSERIWLITGPNMAGKSTFLRQTAHLAILAQTGSFVPAAHAELGLVDQIFSRVGSADNLAAEQSTFMVEMLETSAILRRATRRSLVVMDEVGRGTTPEDGLAVGFAALSWLSAHSRCRALFATHFHALADMVRENGVVGVGCYCTSVVEDEPSSDGDVDGERIGFRYDHQLRPGVNRDSHALKVARLAGMPDGVIRLAKDVLKKRGGNAVLEKESKIDAARVGDAAQRAGDTVRDRTTRSEAAKVHEKSESRSTERAAAKASPSLSKAKSRSSDSIPSATDRQRAAWSNVL